MQETKGGKILILMGLPGSGKTTFAKQYAKEHNAVHVDMDERMERLGLDVTGVIQDYIRYTRETYIIDGLFLTNDDLLKIIMLIKWGFDERFTCKVPTFTGIEIHHWHEDRKKCEHNDCGRRALTSENTIKSAKFEKPNLEFLKEKSGIETISIVYHDIVEKPNWKVMADQCKISLKDEKYMDSYKWCLGGVDHGYMGDETYYIEPETPHTTFDEFENLILRLLPDISYKTYKRLYQNCVTTETETRDFYYGGEANYMYFRCDVEKLFSDPLFEDTKVNEISEHE